MRWFGIVCVACLGLVLAVASSHFPPWGDPHSPASTHVSPRYIEKSVEETAVPNIVTAVLADYRGYDTMFETTVIFAAGLACFMLLRRLGTGPQEQLWRHIPTGVVVHVKGGVRPWIDPRHFEPIDRHWTPHDLVTLTSCRIMIPFLQLFALYVVAHGHHSPGGGFQGGVILGAALILLAISHNLRTAAERFSETTNGVLSGLGVSIYAGVGMACLVLGGAFLDYKELAGLLGVDKVHARSLGIFFVEVGVAITVMAVMYLIYRNVSSAGECDEGL